MILKTRRRCIALVAALLCATTASAQQNRGTPNRGPRARPTPSDSALATFPTLTGSSTASRRTSPISATPADWFLNKAPAWWPAEANN